jgi:DNA-directed RNA polymerase specialized sigma24 family protein
VEVSGATEGPRAARRERTDGLTPASLEALLAFLDPDRERAGELYETIRRKLVRMFEWRGFGNADDLADETINRVARRITEGIEVRSSDPYGYFCGVAHLVSKEVARRSARERVLQEQADWPQTAFPEEPDDDDRLACLRNCLGELPEDQRRLVLRYHQEDDHIRSRQILSQELGLPMNALRIRVHRIRRKLEDCVRECLHAGSSRARR